MTTSKRRFGSAFWQVVGLLSSKRRFKSRSALAKEVIGDHGRPITRQRVRAIISMAVDAGVLKKNPFKRMPQMRRDMRSVQK